MTTSFRRRLCPSQVRGLVDAEGVGVSPCVNRMEEHASWNKYGVSYSLVFWSKACKVVGIPDFCCMIIFSINFCESRIHANFHYIISIFQCMIFAHHMQPINLVWDQLTGRTQSALTHGHTEIAKIMLEHVGSTPKSPDPMTFLRLVSTGSGDDGAESRFWTSGTVAKQRSSITWPLKGYFLHLVPGKPSPTGKPWRSFCWDWVPSLHVSVLRFSWLHFGPSISFSNGTGVLEDKHQI